MAEFSVAKGVDLQSSLKERLISFCMFTSVSCIVNLVHLNNLTSHFHIPGLCGPALPFAIQYLKFDVRRERFSYEIKKEEVTHRRMFSAGQNILTDAFDH